MNQKQLDALKVVREMLGDNFSAYMVVIEHQGGSNSIWSGNTSTGLGLLRLGDKHIMDALTAPKVR